MNLHTETNSLMNYFMANKVAGEIKTGVAATILSWTDRSPATIIEVEHKGKSTYITVQYDHYTRVDDNGMSEEQEYEYSRDLEGATLTFRSTNNKGWVAVRKNPETGRWIKGCGYGLLIGQRERYHDFSF